MTREEYYELLKEALEKVNQDNLEEIKRYNRWKEDLRKELED